MARENGRYAQHISQQYNIDLDGLKGHLLEMGGLVENQVNLAIEALIQGDTGLAQEVRQNDKEVNQMELAIDEACARVLARRQPAASDLRLVIAIGKLNTDLERVGDEAGKIAKQSIKLSENLIGQQGYGEIRLIGEQVCDMLRQALDAFARLDPVLALAVARRDKSIDKAYKAASRTMVDYMRENPGHIDGALNVLWVLRSLERVGDHARNIAECVIYLVKGEDVRHQGLKNMAERVHDER